MVCGAIIGGADERTVEKLRKYALNIGLAFQVCGDWYGRVWGRVHMTSAEGVSCTCVCIHELGFRVWKWEAYEPGASNKCLAGDVCRGLHLAVSLLHPLLYPLIIRVLCILLYSMRRFLGCPGY